MQVPSSNGSSDAALVIRQHLQKLYAEMTGSEDTELSTTEWVEAQVKLQDEQTKALVALFEMGSTMARRAILDAFLDKTLDYSMRSSIARGFSEQSEPWYMSAMHRVVGDKTDNQYVRVNTEEALVKHCDKTTIELLIRVLGDVTDATNVRRMAARVLAELGATEALDPLIRELEDSDWQVQCDAAHALAELADPRAVEPLMHLLEQPLKDGRARGCAALRLTDSRLIAYLSIEQRQELTSFLLSTLADKSENRWLRLHSAGALGRLGDAGVVAALVKALDDKDAYLRNSIAHALGTFRGAESTHALVHLLRTDEDGQVRAAAIYALLEAGTAEQSIELIRQALSDESLHVRHAAVHAAYTLADVAVLSQLIGVLRDPDPYVRSYAIYAVGALGNEDSIPALQWIVENDKAEIEGGEDEEDDGKLSTMAAQAIKRIRERNS